MMSEGATINELALRAAEWVGNATPAELWHVLQHGGIDARVGMPGVMEGLGALPGPDSFESELRKREWAAGAEGDADSLAMWFEGNADAQAAARDEIFAAITEMAFDLGEWEWKGDPPGRIEEPCSRS